MMEILPLPVNGSAHTQGLVRAELALAGSVSSTKKEDPSDSSEWAEVVSLDRITLELTQRRM